jgi:hypothetical protein
MDVTNYKCPIHNIKHAYGTKKCRCPSCREFHSAYMVPHRSGTGNRRAVYISNRSAAMAHRWVRDSMPATYARWREDAAAEWEEAL